MKEAMFYSRENEKRVKCSLCPRSCRIAPGKRGFCSVRENQGGRLVSLVYGKADCIAIDPIEKKPLSRFRPGTHCLSFCTVGCNLDCSFCQNFSSSHPERITGDNVPPERIVELAIEHGVEGIAYTYTEPTVFFEYALDTMRLARKAGLYNAWVSNGYTSPEAAMQASRYMDAINIDLKGTGELYSKLCGSPSEAPVKRAAKLYNEQGVHVEITTLIIPGYNDSTNVLTRLTEWVAKALGKDTPIHFSRFHPQFRMMDAEPTPIEAMKRAAEIAGKAGLKSINYGNIPSWELDD